MNQKISLVLKAQCLLVALLAGCGGGGSGGGGGIGFSLPTGGPTRTPTPISVNLSGVATYDSVPNTSGALLYGQTVAKPVRGAYVEVLDAAGKPIANTVTDDRGTYSVQVPAGTDVIVRVRAQSTRTGTGPTWDVSVRDNTQSGALYSMQSDVFPTGTASLTRNLRAETGWGGSSYTGRRAAAPFAVLDTIYDGMQKVASAAPTTAFPALKVFWSVNNLQVAGRSNPAIGQIPSSHFFNAATGREIYLVGKEDVDTDEFDTSVIAHEWGHYYQSAFSRDDSPGGEHSWDQRLDRRVAFSEGWGNGWSGIALGRSNYTDSIGPRQANGTNLDLTTGPASNPGWFNESSIQSIIWNLNQRVGFKPIHDAMTSTSFRWGAPVTSIHPFSAAFNAANPGSAPALAELLTKQNISAAANDPFGTRERNSGGSDVPNALPLYLNASIGVPTSNCISNVAGISNKLGNTNYLRFTAPATRTYEVSVVATTAGATPHFDIYGGRNISRTDDTLNNLPAGEYVIAVGDDRNTSACFDVTIR